MPESDPTPSPFQHGTTRRTVLRAAGLAALAGSGVGLLSACSSDAEVAAPAATSGAPSSPAAASPSAASSPSASPSAASSPSASASAKPKPKPKPVPSGPSVAAAKVPVGSGVILEDEKYVVTQPTKGKYKAFSSTCTHQGCPVSEIRDDAIICNCHGSQFSIADGSVLRPPADEPLKEVEVAVAGDEVVVLA